MRLAASYGLGFTALFLSIVAVLTGTTALFYMGTAVIATIVGARLQSYFSVKNLTLHRHVPHSAMAAQLVTIEWTVTCQSKWRHPLISIIDSLPKRMEASNISPSFPIAPTSRGAVKSQYQFRPRRRGVYIWSGATAYGIDALGIAGASRFYKTEPSRLVVLPSPIPISLDMPRNGYLEAAEIGSGRAKGGLEFRGVRDYTSGDSLRHVHWRSTAKTGNLLVKEFETGSVSTAAFLIQRTKGTDIGSYPLNVLDLMCGQAAYAALEFRRHGLEPSFPQIEESDSTITSERDSEILEMIAELMATEALSLGEELIIASDRSESTSFYLFIDATDDTVPVAIGQASKSGHFVTAILYDHRFLDLTGHVVTENPASVDYARKLEFAGANVVIPDLKSVLPARK